MHVSALFLQLINAAHSVTHKQAVALLRNQIRLLEHRVSLPAALHSIVLELELGQSVIQRRHIGLLKHKVFLPAQILLFD